MSLGKDVEEQFEEKYLSDMIDRVIFEYVRGYEQTELDGGALDTGGRWSRIRTEYVAPHHGERRGDGAGESQKRPGRQQL